MRNNGFGFGMMKTVSRQARFAVRGTHRSSSTKIEQDLRLFPEYESATSLIKEGKFAKALPSFHRVLNVCVSATGNSSPLTMEVTLRCSSLLIAMGQFQKAGDLLQLNSNNISGGLRVRALLLESLSDILRGDFSKALKQAMEATHICENSDGLVRGYESISEKEWESVDKPALLSKSYSMQGLSHLCAGNYSDAEVYLQLAARWATSPLLSNISLNNLGALMWLRDDLTETNTSASTEHYQQIQQKLLSPVALALTKDDSGEHQQKSGKAVGLVKEALSYWEEAVENASKEVLVEGSGAVCGPASSTTKGEPAGPGVGAIFISKSDAKLSSSPETYGQKSSPLDLRLKDVSLNLKNMNFDNMQMLFSKTKTLLLAHNLSANSIERKFLLFHMPTCCAT